jgi:hypothetical protein
MAPLKIAIVPRTSLLSLNRATSFALALQEQVISHFEPLWQSSAIVTAFSTPQSDFIPIFIVDQLPSGLSGVHVTDEGGLPYALVQYGPSWSLSASHECLELIADPTLNRRSKGLLPSTLEPVEFIVEVCDPCQDSSFAYFINSWLVSDFYIPSYFDDVPSSGATYSFNKNIREPRSVLKGGTLAWVTPDGQICQENNQNGITSVNALGFLGESEIPARAYLNKFDQAFSHLSQRTYPPSIQGTAAEQRNSIRLKNARVSQHYKKDIEMKAEKFFKVAHPDI